MKTERLANEITRKMTSNRVSTEKMWRKLKALEDIEEAKGCPLLVLHEVSKTWKIYSTWLKDYMRVTKIVLWEESTRPYMECLWRFDDKGEWRKRMIFIDQYKETWSLRKEELE